MRLVPCSVSILLLYHSGLDVDTKELSYLVTMDRRAACRKVWNRVEHGLSVILSVFLILSTFRIGQ